MPLPSLSFWLSMTSRYELNRPPGFLRPSGGVGLYPVCQLEAGQQKGALVATFMHLPSMISRRHTTCCIGTSLAEFN